MRVPCLKYLSLLQSNNMKKIVVIEDDNSILENLISLLEVEGFEVYPAEMGAEGIKLIKEFNPDLILCDVMLPDTDGYQILNSLKSDPATSTIPFVFLTAKAEMKDLRSGMNLGADDYLTKPYDAKELIAVVNTRIARNYSEQQNETVSESIPVTPLSADDIIFVRVNDEVKKLAVKSIVVIQADAEYTILFLEDGAKIHLRKLIKSWEEILPENFFVRVHKSTIINLSFLLKIEKWFNNAYQITLQHFPTPIISSRRYSAKLRAKLVN